MSISSPLAAICSKNVHVGCTCVQVRFRVGGFGRMKLQPLLYLPVGRTLIEHAYPMLRCTAYTVSPVHLLQVRALALWQEVGLSR